MRGADSPLRCAYKARSVRSMHVVRPEPRREVGAGAEGEHHLHHHRPGAPPTPLCAHDCSDPCATVRRPLDHCTSTVTGICWWDHRWIWRHSGRNSPGGKALTICGLPSLTDPPPPDAPGSARRQSPSESHPRGRLRPRPSRPTSGRPSTPVSCNVRLYAGLDPAARVIAVHDRPSRHWHGANRLRGRIG